MPQSDDAARPLLREYREARRRWGATRRGTVEQAEAWLTMISAFNRLSDEDQRRLARPVGEMS